MGQGEVANKKGKKKGEKRERKMIRTAAGDVWEDTSLMEWDDNDFRYIYYIFRVLLLSKRNF